MKSFRITLLRLVGVAQIIAALILFALLLAAYSRQSIIFSIFVPMADAVAQTADTVSLVAREIESKQNVLDNTKKALESYRKSTRELKTVSNELLALVPKYEGTLRKSSATVHDLNKTFSDMSTAMRFELPVIRSWYFDVWKRDAGFKEKWCPLDKQADQIAAVAGRMNDAETSFTETADFLKDNTPKLKENISTISESTDKMLEDAIASITQMQNKSMKEACSNLEQSSKKLLTVSSGLKRTNSFLNVLFLLGLALAFSVGLSGVTSFMIAASLRSVSSTDQQ